MHLKKIKISVVTLFAFFALVSFANASFFVIREGLTNEPIIVHSDHLIGVTSHHQGHSEIVPGNSIVVFNGVRIRTRPDATYLFEQRDQRTLLITTNRPGAIAVGTTQIRTDIESSMFLTTGETGGGVYIRVARGSVQVDQIGRTAPPTPGITIRAGQQIYAISTDYF